MIREMRIAPMMNRAFIALLLVVVFVAKEMVVSSSVNSGDGVGLAGGGGAIGGISAGVPDTTTAASGTFRQGLPPPPPPPVEGTDRDVAGDSIDVNARDAVVSCGGDTRENGGGPHQHECDENNDHSTAQSSLGRIAPDPPPPPSASNTQDEISEQTPQPPPPAESSSTTEYSRSSINPTTESSTMQENSQYRDYNDDNRSSLQEHHYRQDQDGAMPHHQNIHHQSMHHPSSRYDQHDHHHQQSQYHPYHQSQAPQQQEHLNSPYGNNYHNYQHEYYEHGHGHQQQHQQQQHHMNNNNNPRTNPNPAFRSIFNRLNKSIDVLADVDTIISRKTESIAKTLISSSSSRNDPTNKPTNQNTRNNRNGGLSILLRRTALKTTESVTTLRDGIKDGVAEGIGGMFIFGGRGAPTHSSESRNEWEDDRRSTASLRRRRTIMGSSADEGGDGGVALQRHLDSLVHDNIDGNEDGYTEDDRDAGDWGEDQDEELVDGNYSGGVNAAAGPEDLNGMHSADDTDWHASMSDLEPMDDADGRYDISSINENTGTIVYGDGQPSNGSEREVPKKSETIVDPSTFFGGGGGGTISSPQEAVQHSSSNYYNDDDFYYEDGASSSLTNKMKNKAKSVISSILPPLRIPIALRPRSFRRSRINTSEWSDDEDWITPPAITSSNSKHHRHDNTNNSGNNMKPTFSIMDHSTASSGQSLAVKELLQRRNLSTPAVPKATANLLSAQDLKQCVQIGRRKAFMDFLSLVSMLFFLHKLLLPMISLPPLTIANLQYQFQGISQLFEDGRKLFLTVSDTIWKVVLSSKVWVSPEPYYAIIVVLLSTFTNNVLFGSMVQEIATNVLKSIKANIVDAQLYLRLVSGIPLRKWELDVVSDAAQKQVPAVVENVRNRSFAFMVIIGLSFATIPIFKLVATSVVMIVYEMVSLDVLRQWPIQWVALKTELMDLILPFEQNIRNAFAEQLSDVKKLPIALLPKASLFVALCGIAFLPFLERMRVNVAATIETGDASLEDDYSNIEIVSNMGKSSSSRLFVQSHDGAIESILRRWKQTQFGATSAAPSRLMVSNTLILRKLGFGILYSMLTLFPFLTHIAFTDSGISGKSFLRWDRCIQIGLLLSFTLHISKDATSTLLDLRKGTAGVISFLDSLETTMGEVNKLKQSPKADLQLSANSSASKGILVSDLWAAHTSRRAWACKASSISCNNGEVVVVLGDNASGKSRLLTAIGETIMTPTRRSRSTTLARGLVSVGGVDVTKWDKGQLKEKVTILLNDVRTLADTSQLLSGLTLQDILEPSSDSKATSIAARKSAVELAMQITGLSDTLLERLDTELLTTVTSNEEELGPSTTQFPLTFLSPAEWSKVILTKVIARSILLNDSSMSSPDSVPNCLLGTILLLDDVTLHFSEIEEAKLIKSLRISGAATILTSNRWSLGRSADRVAVIRNGSIVETGTHSELFARGDQRSLYAVKWSEMAQE